MATWDHISGARGIWTLTARPPLPPELPAPALSGIENPSGAPSATERWSVLPAVRKEVIPQTRAILSMAVERELPQPEVSASRSNVISSDRLTSRRPRMLESTGVVRIICALNSGTGRPENTTAVTEPHARIWRSPWNALHQPVLPIGNPLVSLCTLDAQASPVVRRRPFEPVEIQQPVLNSAPLPHWSAEPRVGAPILPSLVDMNRFVPQPARILPPRLLPSIPRPERL